MSLSALPSILCLLRGTRLISCWPYRRAYSAALKKHLSVKRTLNQPPQVVSLAAVAHSRVLYQQFCFNCHGDTAVSGAVLPDLRYSPFNLYTGAWHQVVIDGVLSSKGMVSFKPVFSENDSEDIRSYVIKREHDKLVKIGSN
ncbi:MAG: alcohol dehydrogenase (cytochrome c)/quinohemoprotein ethanol dehydrogenase [Psychromonas sp.]|jgi:alcohol dehydrogenase (cytochrome c)/quinohemoprotein ethanol dehydrogenase|uniref:c-type cytochrome n=1 Tax=Glaciecola sp. 33A TaxID=2057807 RepID=UPI000C31C015|nr:cytochrome c [Glaciecola sp. 33A]PKI03067.1 hypothetical protein CXF81_03605 [Glaciecola sp. 33A]